MFCGSHLSVVQSDPLSSLIRLIYLVFVVCYFYRLHPEKPNFGCTIFLANFACSSWSSLTTLTSVCTGNLIGIFFTPVNLFTIGFTVSCLLFTFFVLFFTGDQRYWSHGVRIKITLFPCVNKSNVCNPLSLFIFWRAHSSWVYDHCVSFYFDWLLLTLLMLRCRGSFIFDDFFRGFYPG